MENESYTKEEIELLDRFAGIVLGVALSEFNLANGVSNGVVDIVCNDSYITAKSMLRARKEALNNV